MSQSVLPREDNEDVELANERTPLLQQANTPPAVSTNRPPSSRPCFRENCVLLFFIGFVLFGGVAVASYLINHDDQNLNNHNIPFDMVSRKSWRAQENAPLQMVLGISKSRMGTMADHVVIAHTGTPRCAERSVCENIIRQVQADSVNTNNLVDIPYNFLVGGDGQTYEGRGWNVEDAFTANLSYTSMSIAFIGNFSIIPPPRKQIAEAKALIVESIRRQKLQPTYQILGECQLNQDQTDSPGEALMEEISRWQHWRPCLHKCS